MEWQKNSIYWYQITPYMEMLQYDFTQTQKKNLTLKKKYDSDSQGELCRVVLKQEILNKKRESF